MKRNELESFLASYKLISVVSHTSPDADAYGSLLAMYLLLKNNGYNVEAVNESGQVKKYNFIPNFSEIKTEISNDSELIIICDCGELKRVGDVLVNTIGNRDTLNIDHHISNKDFGTKNIVITDASSTCEIIFDLAKEFEITKDIATCLFAGIFADTGGFRYSNTTSNTFKCAAELVVLGANPENIAKNLFANSPLNEVILQAKALSKIQTFFNGKYAEIVLTNEDFAGVESNASEGLAEKARDIENVEISCLIRWDKDLFKVSLRSKSYEYNVSDLAEKFGGGGHRQAAAFRWREDLDTLLSKLRVEIKNILK